MLQDHKVKLNAASILLLPAQRSYTEDKRSALKKSSMVSFTGPPMVHDAEDEWIMAAKESAARKFACVGIIGAGVLGEALLARLVIGRSRRSGGSEQAVIGRESCKIFDVSFERAQKVARLGDNCEAVESVSEVVNGSDLVIIAVKPQNITSLFKEMNGVIQPHTVMLSVMAGTKIGTLMDGIGCKKVIRSMPNTPVAMGQGVVVWAASEDVNEDELEAASIIFRQLGDHIFVKDEQFIDMATAISGSGPAYVYLAMESLVDAAVHLGFPRAVAVKLVQGTFQGTAAYAKADNKHLAAMRNEITSPGGTTAAALYVLEKGGIRTALNDAVFAAYRQANKLGSNQDNNADSMESGLDDDSG